MHQTTTPPDGPGRPRSAAGSRRRGSHGALVAAAVLAATALPAGPAIARVHDTATPADRSLTLDVSGRPTAAELPAGFQGFSVESADFAHGFLTRARMAERLKTLGRHGVLRLGGYSMDLVWPTFGAWRNAPAPEQAIGGTVDQTDFDALKDLLDATGWKVTLGVPLKAVIDPSKLKDPTKDPAPPVTLDQAVAEVEAAHDTLGDDLLSVEIGNEFDNVTTLSGAEMWNTVKGYQAAIDAALPHAGIKVSGPSANTSPSNTVLDGFTAAAAADPAVRPERIMAELSSHLYPASHCGSSTATIAQLMSADTHRRTQTKLQGVAALATRFGGRVPMTVNESNSASCSGQPGVSDAYAAALWSLDHTLESAQSGMARLEFHTNTAALCGDFKPRTSPEYPISYRYYGAFCATDQAELDADRLSPSPLYYGLWAAARVARGRFVDVSLPDDALDTTRAYAVEARDGSLTVVLINVQDPADPEAAAEDVSLVLPSQRPHDGRTVRLSSAAPGGLAAQDASRITLGGATVAPTGRPSGPPRSTAVPVHHGTATVRVAAGTAEIVTFGR